MSIYGILRALRGGWGLACFWFYTIAFLIALPTVFLFPPATIVMFGSALLSLPFAVLIGIVIRVTYRAWSRRVLAACKRMHAQCMLRYTLAKSYGKLDFAHKR